MALDKFKAPTLPAAPPQYNPDYFRQVFRAVEIYFSQLDSSAYNNASRYTADEFVGGSFSTTSVVLDPNASETIDGAATKSTTTQYARFVVVCDGSTWWVIG